MKTILIFLALGVAFARADPQLTAWFTSNSGKHARIVEASTHLVDWMPYWIGPTSETQGGVIITVLENGTANDTITVQILVNSNTRFFTRVRAELD